MTASTNHDWTSDVIARLRCLWDEGHSTAEIGRRLNVSKNAVVGKAHRLDLPARPTPIRRRDPSSPPSRPRRSNTVPHMAETLPLPSDVPPLPAPPKPVAVIEQPRLTQEAPPRRAMGRITPCCWPIGEPGRRDFRFCEEPSAPGKPYCDEHSRTAYVRPQNAINAPSQLRGGSARRHA